MALRPGSSRAKGETSHLSFGTDSDTATVRPKDLTAHEISVTLFFIYAVSFFEGADFQLLPASFRALEADLGLSPSTLAASTLLQTLTCATFSVFWGVLVDNSIMSPQQVLFSGCTGWGIITLMLATINDTSWILVLRLFNGVALATLSPTTQTLIADLAPPQERGRYFSWLGFSMALGAMTTAAFSTAISEKRICGLQGWRIAFAVVGTLSVILGHFVKKLVRLPTDSPSVDQRTAKYRAGGISFVGELKVVFSFFEVWSFSVIVLQASFNCIPWSAMSFGTMFVQYAGVSDTVAGCLSSLMLMCCSIGCLVGGCVGDALAKWNRFHGRPFTAQLSALIAIPVGYFYYMGVPRNPDSVQYWLVLVIIFGLCATWCDHGVNRPMLTEVVAPKHRARILGVLCSIAGSAGALGGPIVALISEAFFGYKTQHKPIHEVPEAIRIKNVNALGNSLTLMCVIPWIFCFIISSALHWTYEADLSRLQAKQEAVPDVDDEEEELWLLQPPFWTGGSP